MSNGEVKKLLVKLIDTSRVMMDLAYTALIYGNKDIAEEVLILEEDMDELRTRFEQQVISMKNKRGEEKEIVGLLRLGFLAEKLSDAAASIAEVVDKGIASHPVIKMAVEEAEDSITLTPINKRSTLVGKTINELKLEDRIGVHIIAVKKGKRWIYNPSGKEKIEEGNLIVASGFKEGLEILEKKAVG